MKSSGASVVGVTGSVGKSTTVATVVACLGPQRVLRLTRPRTTAVGLALDILNGLGSQRVIVAEMQLDGPNQLQLLTRSAVPTVGVITAIGSAHLERFGAGGRLHLRNCKWPSCWPHRGILSSTRTIPCSHLGLRLGRM